MSTLGKQVRLGRLFSHPSGRLCSIAVDHFINYTQGRLPDGIRNIARTLERIVAGRPDAVTLQRGTASSAWAPHAGKVPFILQSSLLRIDDAFHERIATAEDAIRMGAEALALAAFVRGDTEARYLRAIADAARDADRCGLPVVAHVYPRRFEPEPVVSYDPEDIAWAVRCAQECGADIIKVPYPGDPVAYGQIVLDCPVPIVAAGGPRAGTLREALSMVHGVIQSGARGATVGRNVWEFEKVTEAVQALKGVIHDGLGPEDALRAAGL